MSLKKNIKSLLVSTLVTSAVELQGKVLKSRFGTQQARMPIELWEESSTGDLTVSF